jgi:methionyl-tRNA formyltransferase
VRYRILKALLSGSSGKPGQVLSENLEIACGNNSLKILEIQREGKRAQKTNEFILGTKIKKGSDLNNV